MTWVSLLGFLALMQWHFYQVGHDLDTTAPLRNFVQGGFTPPAIGTATLGKIRSTHLPHIGAFAAGLGALLLTRPRSPGRQDHLPGTPTACASASNTALGSVVTK